MALSIRVSQRVWCVGTSLAVALMGCGSTVIEQGGGAGGTTTVSIASTSKSTGVLNPTSGSGNPTSGNPTGSGPMDCQNAADDIAAKLNACGIMSSGSGGDTICTPEEAAQDKALAKCVDDASCDALTGKDTPGAMMYATCIVAASEMGSSGSTVGATGTGN